MKYIFVVISNYIYSPINSNFINVILFLSLIIKYSVISPLPDLIYNSNLLLKSSLLMHLSYEAYYKENRSIFF